MATSRSHVDELLDHHRVQPAAGYESNQNPRSGSKRCFELSAKYAMDHPDVVVVHGIVHSEQQIPVGHAWVQLPDGTVYDGARKAFYDAAGYISALNATEVCRMAPKEIAALVLETGEFGPHPELDKYLESKLREC